MKTVYTNEPEFSNLRENMSLACALNWYTINAEDKDLWQWIEDWCKEENVKVNLVGRKTSEIGTYASLIRMIQRGYPASEPMIKKLKEDILLLNRKKEVSKEEVKVKVKEETGVQCLSNLDAYIDEICMSKITSSRVPVLFSSKKESVILEEEIKKRLSKLDQEKEFYNNTTYKLIRAALQNILKSLEALKDKIRTEKTKFVTQKSPGVVAKNVLYCKKFKNFESVKPEKIVGAKKVYVYDTDSRNLFLYMSTEAGFSFSGTVLKNIDMEKSKRKILRKPDEFLASIQFSISSLNKSFPLITSTEHDVKSRFAETFVILCYS